MEVSNIHEIFSFTFTSHHILLSLSFILSFSLSTSIELFVNFFYFLLMYFMVTVPVDDDNNNDSVFSCYIIYCNDNETLEMIRKHSLTPFYLIIIAVAYIVL